MKSVKPRKTSSEIYEGPAPANNLRNVLIKYNMTSSELGRRLETSRGNIDQLERSKRKLHIGWINRIAAAIPCKKSELISEENTIIRCVSGEIGFGAMITRKESALTEEERIMLEMIEPSGVEEIFRVHTVPPSVHEGCLVVFEEKLAGKDMLQLAGKPVVAKIKSGAEVVKILHEGRDGRFGLSSYGIANDNSPLIEDIELEWCARFRAFIAR